MVGDLDLSYESLSMPDQDQSLLIYVAEPGTPSNDALRPSGNPTRNDCEDRQARSADRSD